MNWEGSWGLDGVRNSFRSVENNRSLELMAICWALSRNRWIVPAHLRVALQVVQLTYDLHIESQKEFSSDDRMWKQLYLFAHDHTDDWSWRYDNSGTIQVPK